jgi:hypothetical protein
VITKTQQLIGLMSAGDWPRALSLANKFRMLGSHRDTIRLAHECRVWPRFYAALGRDPKAAVAAGIAALQQLYPTKEFRRMPPNQPLTGHQIDEHLTVTQTPARTLALTLLRGFTPAQIREAMDEQAGFCTACGYMQDGCEPDAREYVCDDCGEPKVYGAEELALLGWA